MEKELELGRIVSAYNILNGDVDMKYSIKNLDLKFKGKTALKISLLKNKLKEYAITAEETRQSLIKDKYGKEDENNNFIVESDRVNEFIFEYSEVLNSKHTISFTPLTMDDLDGVDVPVEFIDVLIDFFDLN